MWFSLHFGLCYSASGRFTCYILICWCFWFCMFGLFGSLFFGWRNTNTVNKIKCIELKNLLTIYSVQNVWRNISYRFFDGLAFGSVSSFSFSTELGSSFSFLARLASSVASSFWISICSSFSSTMRFFKISFFSCSFWRYNFIYFIFHRNLNETKAQKQIFTTNQITQQNYTQSNFNTKS